MSLFQARDWWSVKSERVTRREGSSDSIEEIAEECDEGCLCVANIDNDSKGGGTSVSYTSALCISICMFSQLCMLYIYILCILAVA